MRLRLPSPATRNRRSSVWLFFALIHAGFLARLLPFILTGGVLSDINFYRDWAYQGFNGGAWEGIDTAWVYPVGALLPMLVATVFGPALYQLAWFGMFAALNAAGTAALLRSSGPRGYTAAYWWLTATALLGPVAVGRLDGLTAPLVIVGMLLVASRPFVASLILSAATWIKVWPAAVVLTALIVSPRRWRILLAGTALSAAIAALVAAAGDLRNITGFLQAQGERGMQLEAPLTTPGLWQAIAGSSGAHVYDNDAINTAEIRGALSDTVAALMSPLLAVAVLVIAGLVVVAQRRGAPVAPLLAVGALALVATLVVFNKVGSPQFMLWIAAVIGAGLVLDKPRNWRYPAIAMLFTAGLTTVVYPIFYDTLRFELNAAVAVLLTLRNLLVISIFAWSVRALWDMARGSAAPPEPRQAARRGLLPG